MQEITIGKMLKNYRTINALTSEQVANQLSITRTRYSQIENNRVVGLSPRTIRKIADLLKLQPSIIVKIIGDKNA